MHSAIFSRYVPASLFVAMALLTGCAATSNYVHSRSVMLDGAQEVPAITTTATAKGEVGVMKDQTIKGSITVSGMTPTAAHVHVGAVGKNGPVIIPMKQDGNVFTIPEGTKLTDDQYKAYQAGELYINVHSTKYKAGEIRGQVKKAWL